jgi:Ca2+-binding RTX toxin-like protein
MCGGDDRAEVYVPKHSRIPVIVDGGPGDDHISGSPIQIGGPGSDTLIGTRSRDVLIGGPGRDRLIGGPGEDILIGGRTTFDQNAVALLAILAEWNAPRPFAARVKNLTDGSGSAARLNGDFFLLLGQTMLDDLAVDQLISVGQGRQPDWLLRT